MVSVDFNCTGNLLEGEVPYQHTEEQGTFTVMVPICLPSSRKPELLFRKESIGLECNEIFNRTYRYKMSEVIMFSGCTKCGSNGSVSSGESPRVILSLVVKEYNEKINDLMSLSNHLFKNVQDMESSVAKRLEWMRKFNHGCIIDDSNHKWRKLRIKEENLFSKKDTSRGLT